MTMLQYEHNGAILLLFIIELLVLFIFKFVALLLLLFSLLAVLTNSVNLAGCLLLYDDGDGEDGADDSDELDEDFDKSFFLVTLLFELKSCPKNKLKN
jgi:hypothetical protein